MKRLKSSRLEEILPHFYPSRHEGTFKDFAIVFQIPLQNLTLTANRKQPSWLTVALTGRRQPLNLQPTILRRSGAATFIQRIHE